MPDATFADLTGFVVIPDGSTPDSAVLEMSLLTWDSIGDTVIVGARRVNLVGNTVPPGTRIWRTSEGTRAQKVKLSVYWSYTFDGAVVRRKMVLGSVEVGPNSSYDISELLALAPSMAPDTTYWSVLTQVEYDAAIQAAADAQASATAAALYDGPKFATRADFVAAVANPSWVAPTVGKIIWADGLDYRYDGVSTGLDGLPGFTVPNTVTSKHTGAVYATPADGLLNDNTGKIQYALDTFGQVTIPSKLRVDGMITLNIDNTLIIGPGAGLTRTTDSASTDPVVWNKGSRSSLLGHGNSSVISTLNKAPKGVVRIGHEDFTALASNFTSTYTNTRDLQIMGMQQYGQPSGAPDIGIYIPNWQVGGNASYFHNIRGNWIGRVNKMIHLHGWANANIISDNHGIHLGNSGIHIQGALDNVIRGNFLHQSADISMIALEQLDNTGAGGNDHKVTYNQIDLAGEPGGTSKAVEIIGTSVGMVGNQLTIMGNNAGGFGTLDATFKKNNAFWIGKNFYAGLAELGPTLIRGKVDRETLSGGKLIKTTRAVALSGLTENLFYKLVDLTSITEGGHLVVEVRGVVRRNGLGAVGPLVARYFIERDNASLQARIVHHQWAASGNQPRMALPLISGSTVTIGYHQTNNGTATTDGLAAFTVDIYGESLGNTAQVTDYDGNPQTFAGTDAGGYGDTGFGQMTGTAFKTALATYTAGTASGTYTAAELQSVMNALQNVARRLKAHEDAMFTAQILSA